MEGGGLQDYHFFLFVNVLIGGIDFYFAYECERERESERAPA